MSGGAVEACGNCGAPLELDDDGRCRWCRVKVRAAHSRVHRADGGRRGIEWKWNWRVAAIAAVAVGLAAGLGVGISSYVGSHQSGPPVATRTGAGVQSVPPGSTDLQALRQDFGPWRQLTGPVTDSSALLLLQSGGWSFRLRRCLRAGDRIGDEDRHNDAHDAEEDVPLVPVRKGVRLKRRRVGQRWGRGRRLLVGHLPLP